MRSSSASSATRTWESSSVRVAQYRELGLLVKPINASIAKPDNHDRSELTPPLATAQDVAQSMGNNPEAIYEYRAASFRKTKKTNKNVF